jgi:hypothetical protein
VADADTGGEPATRQRHKWPVFSAPHKPHSCERARCDVLRRYGMQGRAIADREQYSLDGGETWKSLRELDGRVPPCKGV